MSAWTPAETGLTTGRAPEAPDAKSDLTEEEPVAAAAAKGSCFLVTNGRDGGGGVSRKEATREGGCATAVLRMERGGMVVVSADVTGGGGTRVYMRGRRFSFPLDLLLLMSADFFHVKSGIPPPLASLVEALSTREKVLAKVKVVDTDAGRLDGCRAGGGTAAAPRPVGATGVSWC